MRKGVVATEPVLTLPSTVTDDSSSKSPIRLANETLILAATERVFAGAGFGGATMAAIAEAAGRPKANLHYYFGCKQELYQAVLARTLRDWLEPTHVITPDADPKTAIE
ncbi:MAG: TetR family transcriptional regulator, partial [Rhodoferax sp.]